MKNINFSVNDYVKCHFLIFSCLLKEEIRIEYNEIKMGRWIDIYDRKVFFVK